MARRLSRLKPAHRQLLNRRGLILLSAAAGLVFLTALVWGLVARAQPRLKLAAEEQKLIDLTNAFRTLQDRPPLRTDPALCAVARAHAERMAEAKTAFLPDDGVLVDNLKAAGYAAGEWGVTVSQAADGDLVVSFARLEYTPETRAELLNAAYADVGVGMAADPATGTRYYTQLFGVRKRP